MADDGKHSLQWGSKCVATTEEDRNGESRRHLIDSARQIKDSKKVEETTLFLPHIYLWHLDQQQERYIFFFTFF